jgi:hypothetical protein
MYIILYSGLASGSEHNLISSIRQALPRISLIFCQTIKELSKALLEPSSMILAVVLMISDKNNIEQIVSVQNSLIDRRIILVLPELTKDIVSIAHSFRPRFIASLQDSSREVTSVLSKMRQQKDNVTIY